MTIDDLLEYEKDCLLQALYDNLIPADPEQFVPENIREKFPGASGDDLSFLLHTLESRVYWIGWAAPLNEYETFLNVPEIEIGQETYDLLDEESKQECTKSGEDYYISTGYGLVVEWCPEAVEKESEDYVERLEYENIENEELEMLQELFGADIGKVTNEFRKLLDK